MSTAASEKERRFLREEGGYLALHGKTLLDNGYTIVPIRTNSKSPGFDGWQNSRPSKTQLDEWLKGGFQWAGVGITTKITPAIDVDVRDDDVAKMCENWISSRLGYPPMRIGQAPKRLFLFRTDTPFTKMRSTKYVDEWKDEHQIEILGDGQQFVAYAIHPDTNKPFTWPDAGENPLTIKANELITLTVEDCEDLIKWFESVARDQGWQIVGKGRERSTTYSADTPQEVEDTRPVTITDEELRSRLLLCPGADDYETWMLVGMALYHQYDGEQRGLDLWHDWSETSDKYEVDALDRRWKKDSFEVHGKKRAPITARYILKMSADAVQKTAMELGQKLRDAFLTAGTLEEWNKARDLTRDAEIDAMERSSVCLVAKDRREAITKQKVSLVEIKKALAYSPKRHESMPRWCADWTYDVSDDRFYNLKTKQAVTKQGFDAMHDRDAMTKKDIVDGKANPANSASDLALTLYRIPHVGGRRFMPGNDSLYTENGARYANTYADHEIPVLPEADDIPRDRKNIERVKRHIEHLLVDPKEQRWFLDWISWIVQNPGKHVNHGLLLQGVPGDGKTFWAELLRAVMGVSNVKMLNAHIFHSDFTGWAAGSCVACVEEVRLINELNKYETLNRIKPFTTNNIIEVHPKGKEIINVKNTQSYLLFSNYKDALPIDDTDRRFLIFFSRWQSKVDIEAFNVKHPNYYSDLYNTITDSPGAIRKWLLSLDQREDFNAFGNAPDTPARQQMIRKATPAFIQQIDDMVREDCELCVSADLLDLTEFTHLCQSRSLEVPGAKTISTMLERFGYECLGKVRLGENVRTFYSRNARKFLSLNSNGSTYPDPKVVRDYIEARKARLDDDEL